jgi:hypothetical protein
VLTLHSIIAASAESGQNFCPGLFSWLPEPNLGSRGDVPSSALSDHQNRQLGVA